MVARAYSRVARPDARLKVPANSRIDHGVDSDLSISGASLALVRGCRPDVGVEVRFELGCLA